MNTSRTERLILQEIVDSNKRLEDSSKRMETALFVDKEAGIDGVVNKIKNHEKEIIQYKSDRTKVIGGLAVIAIGWELLKDKVKELF